MKQKIIKLATVASVFFGLLLLFSYSSRADCVPDPVKHKFEGCRVQSNLCGHPCLVVNKPVEKVCGPYDGAPFTYKQECTLANISNVIKDNRYYCGVTQDDKFVNYIVFQAQSLYGKPLPIDTIITSPIKFSAYDQVVVLSGEPAVYGGQGNPSLGDFTPFYEVDKHDTGDSDTSAQCEYIWGRMSFNLEKKPDYKASLWVKDIPAGKSAFEVGYGTLILRNIRINAGCSLPKCGSIFRLTNGAKLILDNSEIFASQPDVGDESVPHYTSIIDIFAPPYSELDDFVSFREGMGTDSMTKIASSTDSFIKTSKPLIVAAGDFAGAKFSLGFQKEEGDKIVNEFWNGNAEFIDVHNYPIAECALVTGKKKCVIDNSEDQLKYSTAPGYSHVISVSQANNAFSVLSNFQIDGTKYTIDLPADFRPDKFGIMTNLGQKIKVICPGRGTMALLEGGALECRSFGSPATTMGNAVILQQEGAEGSVSSSSPSSASDGDATSEEGGTTTGGSVLDRSEETSPWGTSAGRQGQEAEGGSFCTVMHAPAPSGALAWLVYMGIGLGTLLWRRTRP